MANIQKHQPSPAQVKKYKDICLLNDKQFAVHDHTLAEIFNKYPSQTDMRDVTIKVTLLNDFYSTVIRDTYGIAEHIIVLKNLQSRILNGDKSVVEEIANTGTRRHYSFATKYCSFHNPKAFPIYDSYVAKVLYILNKRDKFFKFTKTEIFHDYSKSVAVIDAFMKHYGLKQFDYKQIDRYLWRLGKDSL